MKTKKSFYTFFSILAIVFLSALFTNNLSAQDQPTEPIYVANSFMKVKPENIAQYKKLEKAWKKIHEARRQKGTLTDWFFYELAIPYGTGTEYNYSTINIYVGNKALAGHYEGSMSVDFEKILTPEEMELVKKTDELRDLVKEEIFQLRGSTKAVNKSPANVVVVNYMKTKDGYRGRDLGKIENEFWKPVHQEKVNTNKMHSWGLYSLNFPFGKSNEYNVVTVDEYDNMEQLLSSSFDDKLVKKIHPNKDADSLLKETNKIRDLVRADIWMLVDYTSETLEAKK